MVQAQTAPAQQAVHSAFLTLPTEDQKTLAYEMALTGRASECYRATPRFRGLGPALLVYYGPALLRQAAACEQPTVGLRCLAEVYRAARELWPLSLENAARCVTLRVDRLKASCLPPPPPPPPCTRVLSLNRHGAPLPSSTGGRDPQDCPNVRGRPGVAPCCV